MSDNQLPVATPDSRPFQYRLVHQDAHSHGRIGVLSTPRGDVHTPTFMPVGTQGTVKGVTVDQLVATGAQIILGNTYHLALRPGSDRVRELGGLHEFSGWKGNILTDSGGFQIFSLAERAKITEKGAEFQSHIDGRKLQLTPEDSIRIQEDLGSDIAMVLDHVIALPATREAVLEACDRSIRWAARCLDAASRKDQAKFAIVQGGLDAELRVQCAAELTKMDFDGFAVGGLSVGEPPPEMYRILSATCPHLPIDKPRYLMGVGKPIDLVEGILRGIDMFDCVMPTRNGRNALAFTSDGTVRLRNLIHADDRRPLEEDCPCIACRHSKAYLRHLFIAEEMLGPILLSIHNLTFYQRVMNQCRIAIQNNTLVEYVQQCREKWVSKTDAALPE